MIDTPYTNTHTHTCIQDTYVRTYVCTHSRPIVFYFAIPITVNVALAVAMPTALVATHV